MSSIPTEATYGCWWRAQASGNPTWSPDSTRLAYTNSTGVYIVSVNGGPPQQINKEGGTFVTWSPDGKSLALETLVEGSPEYNASSIDLINVDGSGGTTIVDEGRSPAWSPDGSKLAYIGSDVNRDLHGNSLHTVNRDGSGNKRLLRLAKSAAALGFSLVGWSPNGTALDYVTDAVVGRPLHLQDSDIAYSIGANGSGRRRLFPLHSNPRLRYLIQTMSWQPPHASH